MAQKPRGQPNRAQEPRGGPLPAWGKRFEKHRQEPTRPDCHGLVHRVYTDAIECARPNRSRGTAALWGVIVGVILGSSGWFFSFISGEGFPLVLGVASGLYACLWLVHGDMFAPEDFDVVVFDRRRRKLLRLDVMAEMHLGRPFRGRRWRVIEHDWDRLAAQHEVRAESEGTWHHELVFMDPADEGMPGASAQFRLSMAPVVGDVDDRTVEAVWEHLRRYMEEGGPPRPAGEADAMPAVRPGWWLSLLSLPLLGQRYRPAWARLRLSMAVLHLALPLALPVFLLWGTLRWLSHLSAEQVPWPLDDRTGVPAAPDRLHRTISIPPPKVAPMELRDMVWCQWRLRLIHAGRLQIDLKPPLQPLPGARRRHNRWLAWAAVFLGAIAVVFAMTPVKESHWALPFWLTALLLWLTGLFIRPAEPGFVLLGLVVDTRLRELRIDGSTGGVADTWSIRFEDLARVYVQYVSGTEHRASRSFLVLQSGRDPRTVCSENLRGDADRLLAWITPMLPRHVLTRGE